MSENKWTVPFSIIAAGVIVAGAIVYSSNNSSGPVAQKQLAASAKQADPSQIKMRTISPSDHILGSPTAKVVMVEYSDTECPFCKTFHRTLHQVMDEYGRDGKVAWVYRHFPLNQLHPKAPLEAEALECAFEQGGENKFWAYLDEIFRRTPSNNGLEVTELPKIALAAGLNTTTFKTCLDSGKYTAKVRKDVEDALSAGGRGTPFTILVRQSDGEKVVVSGAQEYASVKSAIDGLLK